MVRSQKRDLGLRRERKTEMKALDNGPKDVALKDVPDAKIEKASDALVEITSTNICGSICTCMKDVVAANYLSKGIKSICLCKLSAESMRSACRSSLRMALARNPLQHFPFAKA